MNPLAEFAKAVEEKVSSLKDEWKRQVKIELDEEIVRVALARLLTLTTDEKQRAGYNAALAAMGE